MPIGPDLFSATHPPIVTVSLEPAKGVRSIDTRTLSVRLRPHMMRSVRAEASIDRYSPEWSVFTAVSALMRNLAEFGQVPTPEHLRVMLADAVDNWVEPF